MIHQQRLKIIGPGMSPYLPRKYGLVPMQKCWSTLSTQRAIGSTDTSGQRLIFNLSRQGAVVLYPYSDTKFCSSDLGNQNSNQTMFSPWLLQGHTLFSSLHYILRYTQHYIYNFQILPLHTNFLT